jgi:hypothetical protein
MSLSSSFGKRSSRETITSLIDEAERTLTDADNPSSRGLATSMMEQAMNILADSTPIASQVAAYLALFKQSKYIIEIQTALSTFENYEGKEDNFSFRSKRGTVEEKVHYWKIPTEENAEIFVSGEDNPGIASNAFTRQSGEGFSETMRPYSEYGIAAREFLVAAKEFNEKPNAKYQRDVTMVAYGVITFQQILRGCFGGEKLHAMDAQLLAEVNVSSPWVQELLAPIFKECSAQRLNLAARRIHDGLSVHHMRAHLKFQVSLGNTLYNILNHLKANDGDHITDRIAILEKALSKLRLLPKGIFSQALEREIDNDRLSIGQHGTNIHTQAELLSRVRSIDERIMKQEAKRNLIQEFADTVMTPRYRINTSATFLFNKNPDKKSRDLIDSLQGGLTPHDKDLAKVCELFGGDDGRYESLREAPAAYALQEAPRRPQSYKKIAMPDGSDFSKLSDVDLLKNILMPKQMYQDWSSNGFTRIPPPVRLLEHLRTKDHGANRPEKPLTNHMKISILDEWQRRWNALDDTAIGYDKDRHYKPNTARTYDKDRHYKPRSSQPEPYEEAPEKKQKRESHQERDHQLIASLQMEVATATAEYTHMEKRYKRLKEEYNKRQKEPVNVMAMSPVAHKDDSAVTEAEN